MAEGWVSGVILAKAKQAMPGCPVGVNPGTCTACLHAKDPSLCFSCVKAMGGYQNKDCLMCASLSTKVLRDRCFSCLLNPPMVTPAGSIKAFGCTPCCTSEACLQAPGGPGVCANCTAPAADYVRYYGGYNAPNRTYDAIVQRCFTCAANAKLPKSGCDPCGHPEVQDTAGCLKCVANGGPPEMCQKCSMSNSYIQPRWIEQCHTCVANGGGRFCSHLCHDMVSILMMQE